MSVDTICNHSVATTTPDAGIAEAALKMRQSHVGDLVVTQYRNGKQVPVGMVTDRDIVIEVVAQRVDPETLKIADIMSHDVATVRYDNGIAHAVSQMRKAGVRRMPVVDREGSLVGVLSFDDVVQHLAALLGDVAEILKTEQHREVKLRP